MDREIKFRAWNTKRMIYDKEQFKIVPNPHGKCNFGIVYVDGDLYEGGGWRVDFGIGALMQFTGLKDKNGKEIYEGDIIDCRDGKAEIVYIEIFAKFVMDFNLSGKKGLPDFEDRNYQDADTCMRSIEVIGNIYENPELLEKRTGASK